MPRNRRSPLVGNFRIPRRSERIKSEPMLAARSRTMRLRGFTIVELVLVVVILGVISAVAVPRLSRATSGARFAAAQANFRSIDQALALFPVSLTPAPP